MSDRLVRESMDPELRAALRDLGDDPAAPAAAGEARVLAAFDRAWTGRRPGSSRRLPVVWIALAASLIAVVGLSLLVLLPHRLRRGYGESGGSTRSPAVATASNPASGFITLPDAFGLPPLESGQLVRTDLPVSVLPSLGIAPPASHVTTVKADFLVGQDGFARAVRLVNQP
jgi:hypothetical protein